MSDTISFLHSGDMGDIVAGLGAVSEYCRARGKTARMLLDVSGGWHNELCVRDSGGLGMKFNEGAANFLAPLLRAQPYVASAEIWDGKERADIDLNMFRQGFRRPFVLTTWRNLLYCHQQALGLKIGWHGPWLTFPKKDAARSVSRTDLPMLPVSTITARSSRYHSSDQMYRRNRDAIGKGAFIGTGLEYEAFVDCTRIEPNRIQIGSALDAAWVIAGSDTMYVNGTLFYWIAVGLGHPHVVHEVGVNIPTTVFRPFSIPGIEYAQGSGLRAISDLV